MAELVTLIIPAGGSGDRLGAKIPKALVQLGGVTLIERAVNALSEVADHIIVAAPQGYEDQFSSLLADSAVVVTGGASRNESVKAALAYVNESSKFVLVHLLVTDISFIKG